MRLTDIGRLFIVLGTVLSILPSRIQMIGKAEFYFGFIFFGLNLVSGTLKALAQSPAFEGQLRRADIPLMGVLVGVVLTALVQSSTIFTGHCIVMVQREVSPLRSRYRS
jgi:phosphate:Na+ symporter